MRIDQCDDALPVGDRGQFDGEQVLSCDHQQSNREESTEQEHSDGPRPVGASHHVERIGRVESGHPEHHHNDGTDCTEGEVPESTNLGVNVSTISVEEECKAVEESRPETE